MDDRQVRILVVLTAMVAVLGLIYALAPRYGADEPWAEEATHRVWTVEPDQVVSLAVTRGAGPTAVLRREGRTWQLVEPEGGGCPERVEGPLEPFGGVLPVGSQVAPLQGLAGDQLFDAVA